MSKDSKTSEFRRYRQVLVALYLVVCAAGLTLIVASVAKELFVSESVSRVGVKVPSSDELLRCQSDVATLLNDLSDAAAHQLVAPLHDPVPDHGWDDFNQTWQVRWQEINERCALGALYGEKLGVGFDLLAQVHRELPAMNRSYGRLLGQFGRKQAHELARLRLTLERSGLALAEHGQ